MTARTTRGIFPPLLADKGIVAALEAHFRKVGANATADAAASFDRFRFDADVEARVYFCCLQAIQNVIRHAGNAPAVVTLGVDDDMLWFTIHDDGVGFDAAHVERGMCLRPGDGEGGRRLRAEGIRWARPARSAVGSRSEPGRRTMVTGLVPARALEEAAR